MTMPLQKPGRSKQDWATPPAFIFAVKRRLNDGFVVDLAADENNSVAPAHFNESQNSLIQDWGGATVGGWGWLNPPYGDLRPWAEKAANESLDGARIAMLVPSSTGSNWWRDYVVNDAYILFLNGRLTFVGADGPYPKDLALLLYTPFIRSGSAVWDWRDSAKGL